MVVVESRSIKHKNLTPAEDFGLWPSLFIQFWPCESQCFEFISNRSNFDKTKNNNKKKYKSQNSKRKRTNLNHFFSNKKKILPELSRIKTLIN